MSPSLSHAPTKPLPRTWTLPVPVREPRLRPDPPYANAGR